MSKSGVRAIGVILAAGLAFSVPVLAQTQGTAATSAASTSAQYPAWAYPWDPNYKAPADDGVPRHVPDSAATYLLPQVRDAFLAPDWHPEDHLPMPEVVSQGRKPDVRACGYCHRAEGTGGPENSSVAGLPAAYIVQQMADFKSGARKFSGPQRNPVLLMIAAAKAATDSEVQSAAAYFSALKYKPIMRVVEIDTAPKTYLAGSFFAIAETGGSEPLGQRIVEVPANVIQFELRDSRSQFIAHVPVGSVAKGEALVKSGGTGKTIPCGICHGPDLKGIGPIPGIAGRSPSYIVRQLFDFKQGVRAGISSALMKPAVEKLSDEDMISLAAYLASLQP